MSGDCEVGKGGIIKCDKVEGAGDNNPAVDGAGDDDEYNVWIIAPVVFVILGIVGVIIAKRSSRHHYHTARGR